MTIVVKKMDEIIPYENNPRKNEEAVEAVAESIRQCGYIAPAIVTIGYFAVAKPITKILERA